MSAVSEKGNEIIVCVCVCVCVYICILIFMQKSDKMSRMKQCAVLE